MTNQQAPSFVTKHFPEAQRASGAIGRWIDTIQSSYGYPPTQLLLGTSFCSDDIVEMEYPAAAREMLGPFHFGGLNGFPFTGLTGMRAFQSHVPEGGALAFLYGPHIGITENGLAGQIFRPGQKDPSPCCGAAMSALNLLKENKIQSQTPGELDYEEETLQQIMLKERNRILEHPLPEIATTQVIYEAIEARISLLLSQTKPPCKHIFGLGVTIINLDAGHKACLVVNKCALWDASTRHWKKMESAIL